MRLSPQVRAELRAALDGVCRAELVAPPAALRAFGPRAGIVGDSDREVLLADLAAGQLVELEIDLRAFQQVEGVRNRNYTRFRPGLLRRLAYSFKGVPFLADHAQRDIDRRAGTILRSAPAPIDGGYAFDMVAKVTAPWAVEAALRGTLDRFSIGWDYPGIHTIECSVHRAPIFTDCVCFPGDLAAPEDGAPEEIVEFVFTEAEGVEVSAVSVPAVPGTYVESIRTALSRATALGAGDKERGMNLKEIAKALGLPESATEAEIVAATKAATGQAQQLAAQLEQERLARAALEEQALEHSIEVLFSQHARKFRPARDAAGNAVRSEQETQLRSLARTQFDWVRTHLATLPDAETAAPPTRLQSMPEHAQATAPELRDPNAPPGAPWTPLLARQLEALDCSVEDYNRFGPHAMMSPRVRFGLAATREHERARAQGGRR